MNISKFDFTKFTLSKWEEILNCISKEDDEAINLELVSPLVDGEIVPQANVKFVCYDLVDGEEEYVLSFTAFDVKVRNELLEEATKNWRKFMLIEFGDNYLYALREYLKLIREQKIQQADEEYYQSLEDINND